VLNHPAGRETEYALGGAAVLTILTKANEEEEGPTRWILPERTEGTEG